MQPPPQAEGPREPVGRDRRRARRDVGAEPAPCSVGRPAGVRHQRPHQAAAVVLPGHAVVLLLRIERLLHVGDQRHAERASRCRRQYRRSTLSRSPPDHRRHRTRRRCSASVTRATAVRANVLRMNPPSRSGARSSAPLHVGTGGARGWVGSGSLPWACGSLPGAIENLPPPSRCCSAAFLEPATSVAQGHDERRMVARLALARRGLALLAIDHDRGEAARRPAAVPSARSMRRPHPRWNAPMR